MIPAMNWIDPSVTIEIPDDVPLENALRRTTHMAIGAHPDDLEIFAYHGIATCFGQRDKWFTGLTMTDGAGSARTGVYEHHSDEDMVAVRRTEQNQAARVGQYSLQIQLGLSSQELKMKQNWKRIKADLSEILTICEPRFLYLHNPFDKHATHIAVLARCLEALRTLPKDLQPEMVYGCEVWRGLDWLPDAQKVALDTSQYPNLFQSLIGLYDSQISGGKRYDLAALGRQHANATYFDSHSVDESTSITWAIDLTALMDKDAPDLLNWCYSILRRFRLEVKGNIESFL